MHAKTVYFVRHGQAEHNVMIELGRRDEARLLPDPPLSQLGHQQAEALRGSTLLQEALAEEPLVVVSPLCRTLQTALGGLGPWLRAKGGRRLICNADLQETGQVACDTGSPLPTVQEMFAADHGIIDWSEVPEGWHLKEGINKDLPAPLKARISRFQEWLAAREETTVVVVAHHNVFLALLKVSFLNCEVRKYKFDPDTNDDDVLGACFTPITPLVSTCDEEMDESSRRQVALENEHNRRRLKHWGLPIPDRFR